MIENTQKINGITIETTAKCYCPIGNDIYTNQFTITLYPDKQLPDYCEVDKWIKENIEGKTMIVEEAVNQLYVFFSEYCRPKYLVVKSCVKDADHCTVMITKSTD